LLVFGLFGSWSPSAYAVTNLVFSDEFNGPGTNIDTTKWGFDLGNSSSIAGSGWGNAECETYSSASKNAFVSNGVLNIVALNDVGGSAPYSSARLRTLGKFSPTFGRIEVRAKLPTGSPYWWPAIWMLATNYSGNSGTINSWPECGEIDLVESKGSTPGQNLSTLHHDSSGSRSDSPNQVQFNWAAGNGNTNFHNYVMQWGSGGFNFSVDGVQDTPNSGTINSWSSSVGSFPAPFNHPFYIIMNLAVGGTFTGSTSPSTITPATTFPGVMQVDYIRVYQDIPPLVVTGVSPSGGCQSGGTAITITGSNFLSSASVTVGGVPATGVVFVNTNKLTAVTPPNSAGAMNVAVQIPYISPTGTNTLTGTLTNAFTYTPAPSFGGLSNATPAINAATLTWSPASGTAPITYDVFEATTSGGENYASPILITNGLSAFITPLSLGSNCSTTYYFVVRAVDGCGNNDGNTVEQSVQLLAPGPTFAGLGSATPATEAATLSWSAASGVLPVTYNVFEATTSGAENYASPLLTTNGLSVLIAPLYPGSNSPITYFFVTRAVDGCGNSDTNTVEHSLQPLLDPTKSQVNDGIPNGWKQQYNLNPFDPALAAEDPDGDGMSNLQEYLAGTDPTNSASLLYITSVVAVGQDVLVTWMTGLGRTNALQWTAGAADGSYNTNSFADLFTVTNTASTVTNYLDAGAATNAPARYYRVRLVP
jgi:beta-glucanase (GH16 family)